MISPELPNYPDFSSLCPNEVLGTGTHCILDMFKRLEEIEALLQRTNQQNPREVYIPGDLYNPARMIPQSSEDDDPDLLLEQRKHLLNGFRRVQRSINTMLNAQTLTVSLCSTAGIRQIIDCNKTPPLDTTKAIERLPIVPGSCHLAIGLEPGPLFGCNVELDGLYRLTSLVFTSSGEQLVTLEH